MIDLDVELGTEYSETEKMLEELYKELELIEREMGETIEDFEQNNCKDSGSNIR